MKQTNTNAEGVEQLNKRDEISRLLVKHSMPTRQVFISELLDLIQQREAETVERFFNDLREYLNDHPSKITQRIGDKLFWGFEEVNLRRVLRELEQKYDRLAEGGGI